MQKPRHVDSVICNSRWACVFDCFGVRREIGPGRVNEALRLRLNIGCTSTAPLCLCHALTPRQKNSTALMTREHWHPGSRSDYITHLALSQSHSEHHGRIPSHPKHDVHMPKRLQPSVIPDLRFEPTYLAKLAAAGPGWRSVVWVTVRDQVINPLLQGALWCVACRRFLAST